MRRTETGEGQEQNHRQNVQICSVGCCKAWAFIVTGVRDSASLLDDADEEVHIEGAANALHMGKLAVLKPRLPTPTERMDVTRFLVEMMTRDKIFFASSVSPPWMHKTLYGVVHEWGHLLMVRQL